MPAQDWSPQSWRSKPARHQPVYPDEAAVERAVAKLRSLPPLVTSWEIERLKQLLADAQAGKRFVLQGGDCAETLADCTPQAITNKLKILLQMSLVIVHGSMQPVVRIGRFAGQYAKPRSSDTETRGDTPSRTLPSYFGDLINSADFDEQARTPDPHLMVRGYQHAAMTLNFIRALVEGGFADLHHPEYWDLGFLHNAALSEELRQEYRSMSRSLAEALRFMEALGETSVGELTRVEFFTSHEGLHLLYESAQTRTVPRRTGHYCLTTHMPWIGDRTRDPDGAHVEFFRGIENPVGVKVGPTAAPEEVVELCCRLNPNNVAGKLALIHRMGAVAVREKLPPIIEAVQRAGASVVWLCDPMHGNTIVLDGGRKTRSFDDIAQEVEASFEAHEAAGSRLAGVHFELTGEDVTECVGGAAGVREEDLAHNYTTACDPRLNYQQSLELAFRIARRMRSVANR